MSSRIQQGVAARLVISKKDKGGARQAGHDDLLTQCRCVMIAKTNEAVQKQNLPDARRRSGQVVFLFGLFDRCCIRRGEEME